MRNLCVLVGISLPLTLLGGCHNGSNGNADSGSPDLRRNGSRSDGPSFAPDASVATGSCTVNGQTYQLNEAFVDNCITWLCVGADIVEQVSGSLCPDAHAADMPSARKDARTDGPGRDNSGPDAAVEVDGREQVDQGGAPDRLAGDAGSRDVQTRTETKPPLDAGVPDEPPAKPDAPPPEDTVPTGCTVGGVTYAVGDSFASDCNTCFCRADGDVVCTTKACAVDGGVDL